MTRPLWVDPARQAYPALEGDVHVDVAVIGAGFSGLGAAYTLGFSDVSTAILEARTVAAGASGRNAGFVLAGPAAGTAAVHTLGAEETARIWAFTRHNHRLLVRVIEEYDLDCEYVRRGSMSLAASPDEYRELLADSEILKPLGVRAIPVERDDLPVPFDRLYHGGLYYPGNAELNPGQFLRGLARRLAGRVRIFENTPVTGLGHENGTWRLRTPEGTVRAEKVVVCTNAYTPQLLPRASISPTRGQVTATAPLDRVIVPFPMYANHGYQYWRQTPGGRLLIGGWRDLDIPAEVGTDEILHSEIQSALLRFARQVAGSAPSMEYRWAGIMGFTPDGAPLVGPVTDSPGLAVAAGYSGHGVAMAFLCGAQAALTIQDRHTEIPASFDPGRFGL